ncbi:MAG: D-hexose-6-phosphate mutarotase [Chitinophagaceae bacterium]|nr:D-hexose-6-phosphate mutarotase [Chitinophagaceae bacterium]
MIVETLNNRFAIEGKVKFTTGKGNLTSLHINSKYASAEICLYGGQLLSYQPSGQQDVLWVSERSLFENGKAIRGGIPLCFPWFGPHTEDKSKPQHGFARLQHWDVLTVMESAEEAVTVTLGLKESGFSLQLWPHAFNAVIEFVIGKTLDVKLTVTNTGSKPFEYSDALHTYFNISSIASITLQGLQNATFYDAFGTKLKTQDDLLLHFNTETNRRYVNTAIACIIHDEAYNRNIKVSKTGSRVTVVWNPGEAATQTMADMLPDGYKTFVCVEPANAYAGIDMITLKPGEMHTLGTLIEITT